MHLSGGFDASGPLVHRLFDPLIAAASEPERQLLDLLRGQADGVQREAVVLERLRPLVRDARPAHPGAAAKAPLFPTVTSVKSAALA